MFARLAFSVSINVEPDILIVDEALSVGDMAFQMKCFKKFQDFQKEGRTILFVTHGLDTVIRYCNRGIVIDDGKMVFDDTPKQAVDTFKKILSGNFYGMETADVADLQQIQSVSEDTVLLKTFFDRHEELDTYGNGKATIEDYGIVDKNGKASAILDYNSEFTIIMKVRFHERIEDPIFAFTLKDTKGLEITGTNSMMKHVFTGIYEQGQTATVSFRQKTNLQLGKYALSLGCVNINENGVEVYNRIYDAILFEVIGAEQMVGFFDLGSVITIEHTP